MRDTVYFTLPKITQNAATIATFSSTFLNKKTFTIPVQIADIIIITLPQRNASCKELLNITYVKYMNNGNNI